MQRNDDNDPFCVDDSDTDSSSMLSDSDPSTALSDSDSDDDSGPDFDVAVGPPLRPADPKKFGMFVHLLLQCTPAAGEAVCAYLHTTPDAKRTPSAYELDGLAQSMLSTLPRHVADNASLRLAYTGGWTENVNDFFKRLDRLAGAHRQERERLHASDRTLAIGKVFSTWPAPNRMKEHEDANALSYLLVTGRVNLKRTAGLFAVRFGPGPIESARLIGKIQLGGCAPVLDADAAGPALCLYVDLVPTLLRNLLIDLNPYRLDPRSPPGLVMRAIAKRLVHAKSPALPPHAYAALWPSDGTDYPTNYWSNEQHIKVAWFTQNQLQAALGMIAAYEAAETVGLDAPRYGRTDPLGAASLCDSERRLEGLGLLRSDSAGPLSLFQTAQVRIAEAPWRVPLVDLPDDIAAPLALAMWQRACRAPRAKDGTIADALRLLDVAHYWGVQPTEAQQERPEWLCHDLMIEAVARAASLDRQRAVPLAWEDTFRPLFPTYSEHDTMWCVEMAGIQWNNETDEDDNDEADDDHHRPCLRTTTDQMRVYVARAFERIYQRPPRTPDEPLLAKAVELAVGARLVGTDAARRTPTSAKEQATIALGIVRAQLNVEPGQLLGPSMFPKRLCGAFHQLPLVIDIPFRRYRPDIDSDGDGFGDQDLLRDLL